MSDRDVANDTYQHYRFCYDNGHKQFLAKAKRCFDFWNGEQWDAFDKAKRDRERRPALTFNMVESLVRSMVGVQRALRNDVRFVPTASAGMEDARVRDALWMHIQNQNKFEFLEMDVFTKGLIFSRAYYDIRMSYEHSFQGNVAITSPRSQDVILDPSADAYDSDSWPRVITRRWISNNDVSDLYGKDIAESVRGNIAPAYFDFEDTFMAQQMGQLSYFAAGVDGPIDSRTIRAHLLLDHQYFITRMRDVFVDVETGDFKEVPEGWDRERVGRVLENTPGINVAKRRVRAIQWDVMVDDVVAHTSLSPYDHFTTVPYFPSWIDGVARGAVEGMLDPQMMYNKITSNEIEVVSSMANSGYKVKSGSLKNMTMEEMETRGAQPGAIFELADVGDLEKLQPNQVPQGYDRLSFKAEAMLGNISGMSRAGRGMAREDMSGNAILENQANQEINFAGWLANLHRSKQLVATRALELVSAHYSETRTILINRGTALSPSIEELSINQPTAEGGMVNDITKGRYTTVLVPSPSRTSMSEQDFDLLLRLRTEVGIQIPDSMLIELSPAANKGQIIQMLTEDSNEAAAREQALQEQIQQLEMQLAEAKIEKERGAAQLNVARAQKFAGEAGRDPDAAWERVESQRIASGERVQRMKMGQDLNKHRDNVATKLTDISVRARQAAKKTPSAGKPKPKGA